MKYEVNKERKENRIMYTMTVTKDTFTYQYKLKGNI